MSALDDLLHDYSVYQTLPASVEDARYELAQLRAELAAAQKRVEEADKNLISMVNQYCQNTVKPTGTPDTYSHAFMSAGEGAFDYLTQYDLAEWAENGVDIVNLKWPSEASESEK